MVFSVGVRYGVEEYVCRSKEECESKEPDLVPGYVYEVRAVLDSPVPWFRPEGLGTLWEVLKAVRRQYPGISFNYLEVSDDGKTVIIQLFDSPLTWWQVVIILALVLGVAWLAVRALEILTTYIPKAPPWIWSVVAAVAVGGTVASVLTAISRLKRKQR